MPASAHSPSTNPVTCYLVGDEGVLFVKATQRLYRLNPTAAYIWCCCEDGLSPLAIAGAMAERFGISRKLARRDVVRTFAHWSSEGLLFTDAGAPAPHPLRPEQAAEPRPAFVADLVLPGSSFAHRYRLLDVDLRIRYPSRQAETRVHPILAHLEKARGADRSATRVDFDIAEAANGYVLLRDGAPTSACDNLGALAPMIQREALITAYEATACKAAVHAAAVCAERRCVLLPGAKGSGKSTLTAALVAAGFTYLTDELSLLTSGLGRFRAAPVSLGLKSGSWPLLATRFRGLEGLPKHRQADGREVRYLAPPHDAALDQRAHTAECLVFPQYEAGGMTELSSLGPVEALYRLAEAGYAVPDSLDDERVQFLINWVGQLDCYRLRMGDIASAVLKIQELLT